MRVLKYITIALIISVNLIPLYGVFILGWRIADIFFFFWLEYILSLASTYFVLRGLWAQNIQQNERIVKTQKAEFLFFSLLTLFYVTLFALGVVMGELVGQVTSVAQYTALWIYVVQKKTFIGILLLAGVSGFFLEKSKAYRQDNGFEEVTRIIKNKAYVIGIFYFVLMMHYHLSGSSSIPYEEIWYQSLVLCVFVFSKLIIESIIFLKGEKNNY